MTLTRDEILAMTPDQLRIEIARRKGLLRPTEDGGWLIITHGYGTTADWPTSISDAWELVEEMRQHIGHISLNSAVNNDTNKWVIYWLADPTNPATGYDNVIAATAPLAICHAWLLWHEERSEEK